MCSGIISVPVVDASDITLDMIHSLESGAVLICIYFQTLNKHQTRCIMYEIESFAHVVCHRNTYKFIQRGGRKKTGGGEDVLCNDYFSTMRAATDKRSSPVERVDQVDKG